MLIGSRYELREEIGQGGEARVFRALDLITRTEVAVRLPLQPEFLAGDAARIQSHPGWVQLLDCGTTPDQGSFQVFELLHGPTLAQTVQQGPLAPDDWIDFVRQSLDAVEALHRLGWVHGDLNADNFMMTPGSIWKLLELPFLRFTDPTKRSNLFGSIHTLAPEQINGKPADPRSDLYALGCIYYYAACGEYSNAGGRSQDIAVDRLLFPAAPLGEKAPLLYRSHAEAVMKLLARNPVDRPADCSSARQLLGD